MERTVVDDFSIQFGDDHYIEGVLFLFSAPGSCLKFFVFRMGNLDFSPINNAHTIGEAVVLHHCVFEALHLVIRWELNFVFQGFCKSDCRPF